MSDRLEQGGFAATGMAMAAVGVAAALVVGASEQSAAGVATALYAALACLWVAFAVIMWLFLRQRRTRKKLASLYDRLLWLARHPESPLPAPLARLDDLTEQGVDQLSRLAIDHARHISIRRPNETGMLQRIVAGLSEPLLAVTESGQISLINAAARSMLGAETAAVGSSVFDILPRDSLLSALSEARKQGRPVFCGTVEAGRRMVDLQMVDLGAGVGALIRAGAATYDHALEFNLRLHEHAPPAYAPKEDTLLADLSFLVLDTETTGLDAHNDSVVSIGAVRMEGSRVFHSDAIDMLVNPGRPIPRAAQAIHGVTDAMVAGAPTLQDVMPDLLAKMKNCVVVGHNIGYDMAILAAGAKRIGAAWPTPRQLDTRFIIAGLEIMPDDPDLEEIASRLGVDPRGRHTALGDALVTAEVLRALLPELEHRGVRTWRQLKALCAQPRGLRDQAARFGWTIEEDPSPLPELELELATA